MDEQRLIARLLDGDALAARTLYDAHVDRVYRIVHRIAGDEDLARDFTQETFIRAFDRLDGFRGEAALSTWLHSIAVSVALNGMRTVERTRGREVTMEHARPLGHRPRTGDPGLRSRLKEAIGELPEAQKVAFILHEIEGYTHEEIGTMTGVATGTSKARLSRARAALRDRLADLAREWIS